MTVSTTSATPTPIRIDFVSDVSCPWCVVGLKSLEQALAKLDGTVQADIHFQPFELNANMPPEGEDIGEHIARKYGSTPEQMAQSREAIRARGEQLGFTFAMDKRGRIYNTFDAHRLLHWAALEGRQKQLKMALFDAYFTQGQDPSSHEVLLKVAGDVGLDTAKAAEVLASDAYADEVRAQERFYQQNGINSVPAVIINERHLISGGQPPEVFEQALRQIISGA
ncbi:DSBA-like thioredoxin domain protein [Janthinobacterium sp. HH103]|uniref:DsbA family oxidoreductase n=1 Tax=Janthinobacterium agaricidamnosum TaxID=55508 RepID=A0A3G2EED4_9BURK|nr:MULTISPECIES: DsbA family oxidoreductase [Janthinobacterium]AYM78200.1 DsbA family oxidoreductase [Janthinobacterium agaricidamnosum]OEZ68613.1 DSBA-like thioredoxin domain protein [Janthinobacterium sp. HH100]OEZ70847.1 DSBA-like thioredoxin domain protein [Janthinobacterium sp. HH103]QOU75565.1 DSBA-like thioredoxin domain protein [Janthinobacterium sp. HH102]